MTRTLASILRPRWLFWLCAMAVLVLSLLPPTPDMPTTGWDKANHAFGFALLAVLGGVAYPGRAVHVLLGLLAYGAFIEVLQGLTSWRTAEWADLLADAMGLGLGGLALRLYGAHRAKRVASATLPPGR